MNIQEYPDRDMMMIHLANILTGQLNAALMRQERATFAVPGGTTPGPLFDALCAADLDWGRVHVLLTDERWVPEDHERSNTRLLRRRLLTGRAAAAVLLPLHAQAETPEAALPELSSTIAPYLPIDLLLLGMGEDMHTASLLAGADRLADALQPHAAVLLPMRAPDMPELRVSLTMPVLRGAINAHLLIAGANKRRALERAREINDPLIAPVAALLDDISIHWAP